MSLSDHARVIGQRISNAASAELRPALNAGIAEFAGWPFKVSAGRVEDATGKATAPFACVVHTATDSGGVNDFVPADNTAVVIDVVEDMSLAEFRAAYERIAEAKRLQKAPAPNLKKTPIATVTMTMIMTMIIIAIS